MAAIGYFCFVDGRFRLRSFPSEVQILSTTKPGPVVPAKLINKVPPVYPALARQARIQGLVSVNVVIRKDGNSDGTKRGGWAPATRASGGRSGATMEV